MTSRPLFSSVHAGDSHPANEHGEMFDLSYYLMRHPSDTFFVKVTGNSMTGAGIFDGDILIAEKGICPKPSDVVIVETEDGHYTVKHYQKEQGRLRLVPANSAYESIEITEQTRICGVATFNLHKL